jgi:hypothetical protein
MRANLRSWTTSTILLSLERTAILIELRELYIWLGFAQAVLFARLCHGLRSAERTGQLLDWRSIARAVAKIGHV